MKNLFSESVNPIVNSFQPIFGNEELLFQMVDLFPIPIEIFAPDGMAVMLMI